MPRRPLLDGTAILDASSPGMPLVQSSYCTVVPLPRLTIRRRRGETILDVEVFPDPQAENTTRLRWTVAVRPAAQLSRGQAIRLRIGSRTNGVGRISELIGMSRHWVSFKVSGSHDKCRLEVPVTWAALDRVECHAHTRHYPSLAAYPPPHPLFADNLILHWSLDSPYEFEHGNEDATPPA